MEQERETTHHHHHQAGEKSVYMLPTSIVLAALIVAGSMFYNTSAVIKAIDGIQYSAPAAATPTAVAPPGAPDSTPKIVDVKPRDGEPVLGNKNASVTVVEFADFQCPFCKNFFQNTFPDLKKQYIDTGKIKFVFRNFPLTQIHVNAQISSQAAECANQQGKFWEFHDELYTKGQADGTGLAAADLKKYADDLGLNKGFLGFSKNKFSQCLDGNDTKQIVQNDQQSGLDAGISGTPSFIILKGSNTKVDGNVIRTAGLQNKQSVSLSGGNAAIIGAVGISTFQQVLDAALK